MGHPENGRDKGDTHNKIPNRPGGCDDIIEVVFTVLDVGPHPERGHIGSVGIRVGGRDHRSYGIGHILSVILIPELQKDPVGLRIELIDIKKLAALFDGNEDREPIKIGEMRVIGGNDDEIQDDGVDIPVGLPKSAKGETNLFIIPDDAIPILDPNIRVLEEFPADNDRRECIRSRFE